jgi:MFS family permease
VVIISNEPKDYGWKIVAALFVILAFSSGLSFYSHTVFIDAFVTERGFDLAIASGAVSLFFLVSGISGLYIATLLERYDVRIIMGAGAVLASTSLALLGKVDSIVGLYALYVMFGMGYSAAGLLPATTLIARWFTTNRAKAMSISSTGLSIGGVLLTPAVAALIEQYGLTVAAPWMGALCFLGMFPICILVLRSHPAPQTDQDKVAPEHDTYRDPYFWSLCLSYLFVMLAQVGGITHQYGLVSEHLSGKEAALAIGVLPLCSIVGRLLGGVIVDRVSTYRFTLFMMVLQVFALLLMAYADSVINLIVGLAVFGITVGNLLMLQPLLIAEAYPISLYSHIYSRANFLSNLGLASGPALMGFMHTINNSYHYPYLIAAMSAFVACFIFNLIKSKIVS